MGCAALGQPVTTPACPKCGFPRGDDVECCRCGVVFDKVHRSGTAPAPDSHRAPIGREPQNRSLGSLLVLLIAVGAAAYYLQRPSDPLEVPAPSSPVEVSPTPLPTANGAAAAPDPIPDVEPEPSRSQPTATRDKPAPVPPREPLPLEQRFSTYSYRWYEGAAGFTSGIQKARAEGRPVAVYFQTDWCGYCREFEAKLLGTGAVEAYLRYFVKVRINPEEGSADRYIANRYRVNSYPSFFVQTGADARPHKVNRHTRPYANGKWRLSYPSEFVTTLRGHVERR